MNKILEPYMTLVDFIAEFLGENTEVVLHDLTDWHHSVVAIRNGHISGRKVGAPITEVSLKIIRSQIHKEVPFIYNDKGIAKKKDHIRSASWFIKDDDDSLVGMLCINSDCQELIMARNILDKMIKAPENHNNISVEVKKNDNLDAKTLVDNNVSNILRSNGKKISQLTKDEKVALVGKLQAIGTFSVKGTVWYLADRLEVSLPTVYRYITMAKKKN